MKIAIVGSGIGGLIAAAYLSTSGDHHEVHVFEQYHRLGGVLAPYESEGFKWDLGQLLIEGMGQGEPTGNVLKELGVFGKGLSVLKDDRRYVFPDFNTDKPEEYGGPKWRIEKLKELFPEDAKGLDKYYKYYTRLIELLNIGYQMSQTTGIKKILWKLLLYAKLLPLASKSKWSAEKMMDYFFTSKKLKCVFISILADFFTQPSNFLGLGVFALNPEPSFDKRMPAHINSLAKQLYHYSIRGGISTMVDALEKVITDAGGNVHLNSLVTKINVEKNKVTGIMVNETDNRDFDLVVANGGAREIFYDAIGREYLTPEFIEHLDSLPLMDGVFMVHLGLDYDPSPITGDVCTYYYNTYDFEDGISLAKSGIYHGGKEGFVIHIPTVHTTSMAPANHSAMTVYTICPDILQEGSWDSVKEKYADELIAYLEEKVPGLSEHIVKRAVMTPDDFKKRINVKHFAFGGLAPEIGKIGIPFKTCIKNLYYVGAQSQTGGGVNRIITETADLTKKLIRDLR
ncbi:MAG: phytoene desaturase family protein [Promethearchaeota archaeon]